MLDMFGDFVIGKRLSIVVVLRGTTCAVQGNQGG